MGLNPKSQPPESGLVNTVSFIKVQECLFGRNQILLHVFAYYPSILPSNKISPVRLFQLIPLAAHVLISRLRATFSFSVYFIQNCLTFLTLKKNFFFFLLLNSWASLPFSSPLFSSQFFWNDITGPFHKSFRQENTGRSEIEKKKKAY